MVKNKGKGPAQPPQQKKARPSAPSSSQAAKPREGKGSRPASPPATAPNPPPLSASFADATAGKSQQQQQQPSRVSSPIIDVEMAGSRSASPSGTAAPANTTTTSTTTQTPAGQSGAGQKASSGPKGTKRRLALPDWTVGEPLFRVKEWEAYQRPPPKVSHQFVAYVSLKDLSLKARDIIIAGRISSVATSWRPKSSRLLGKSRSPSRPRNSPTPLLSMVSPTTRPPSPLNAGLITSLASGG